MLLKNNFLAANLFIPFVRIYWVSVLLFCLQGFGIGIYEIGGNQIILKLWSGISKCIIRNICSVAR